MKNPNHYRIKTSNRSGICDVCDKHTPEMLIQRHTVTVTDDGETFDVHNRYIFGHRECLESSRITC